MFGSRTTGRYRKFSDVDLFYKDPFPTSELLVLKEELEESNLPYKVDITNYHSCSEWFQNLMSAHNICIQASPKRKDNSTPV